MIPKSCEQKAVYDIVMEFLMLKERNATELELSTWRQRIHEIYGREAGKLLELARLHLFNILEKSAKGDKSGHSEIGGVIDGGIEGC